MTERVCEKCGRTFLLKPNARAGRFCSTDCYYQVGPRGPRKAKTKGNRMTLLPDHPLAPPSGILAYSRIILYEALGPGPHACHWCKKVVNWEYGLKPGALVVDHLDFDDNNDSPSNLVPSCLPCNGHRRKSGDSKLIQEGELTVLRGGKPTRAVETTCRRCGVTFLTTPAQLKGGRGVYCSRDCMYDRNRTPDMSGG